MIEKNTVYQMDAAEFCQSLKPNSVDLICADPPYGKGYRSNWKTTNGHKPRRTSGSFGDDIFNDTWLLPAYNALKPNGAFYCFTQWDVMEQWRLAIEAAGFNMRMVIIWDKLNPGQGDLLVYGNQIEMILFCTKGSHNLRWNKREGNVWRMTKLDAINHEGNFDNATQKPERLIMRMITRSSDVGDVVLDPFIGSGTTAAAAQKLKRNWYACDISEYQVSIARGRLSHPFDVPLFDRI